MFHSSLSLTYVLLSRPAYLLFVLFLSYSCFYFHIIIFFFSFYPFLILSQPHFPNLLLTPSCLAPLIASSSWLPLPSASFCLSLICCTQIFFIFPNHSLCFAPLLLPVPHDVDYTVVFLHVHTLSCFLQCCSFF